MTARIDWDGLAEIHAYYAQHPEDLEQCPLDILSLFAYDWRTWGRDNQQFQNYFTREKNILLALAGRGFGKTRAASEYVKHWLFEESIPSTSILYVAPTFGQFAFLQTDPAGISKCLPPGYKPIAKSQPARLYFEPFDVTMYFSTPDSFEAQARGKNSSLLIYEELCAMEPAHRIEEMFNITEYANRITAKSYPKILITTTPKPTLFLKKLLDRPDVQIIRGSTFDNEANLDAVTIAHARAVEKTAIGRQEVHAEVLFDTVHNLFPPAHMQIDPLAAAQCPHDSAGRTRVVIALDPALRTSPRNDEFGFVVVSKIRNENSSKTRMVVLEDLSGHYSMNQVRNKIIELKKCYAVTCIVVERNIVEEAMVNALREIAPVKATQATKSKGARAALVSPYWEMNRTVFAHEMPELASQLGNFDPRVTNQEDDRLDAFVYGGIEVFNLWQLLEGQSADEDLRTQLQRL